MSFQWIQAILAVGVKKQHAREPEDSGPLACCNRFESQVLGLVAEPLLVAVLLHALLALVLVDLCLTAFLDGAHSFTFGVGLR